MIMFNKKFKMQLTIKKDLTQELFQNLKQKDIKKIMILQLNNKKFNCHIVLRIKK